MTNHVEHKTSSTKAIVAGIGTTLTALTSALAVVSVAVGDDKVDASEIGSIVTALVTMVLTIYGVWRVPNKDIPAPTSYNLR